MEAKQKSLKFLYEEGKVKIPFFQRSYVWDQDNWEDLLSELLNETKNHFLGSIILKQLKTSTGESKQLEVIDGQQRLTTLSILLKALYDTFPEKIKENCKSHIEKLLFHTKDYTSADHEIKIEHSYIDAETYTKVLQANIDNNHPILIEDINGSSHKILQCYKYFFNELKNKSIEERGTLIIRMLESEMLVVIDIDEKDDEQTIFDTINTAGVRLTPADIIKNALFQKVVKECGKEEAITLYRKTWEKTFLFNEDTIKYWEAERLTGRLNRNNIEILLHCIAVIKGFYDPDTHSLCDLSRLYKEELTKETKDELKIFINEIIEYAEIYRENILAFNNTTLFLFEDSVKRLLHILEVLEISTFHPFILYVFNEFEGDKVKNILFNLEKFIIKTMFSNKEKKNYNKLCKSFIKDPSPIEQKLNSTEYKTEFANGLRSISNKSAALLLFWIELYRRHKDSRYDIKELKYNYSLEHIMPQKWEEHWKVFPNKCNPGNSEMTEEQSKIERKNKVFWIGNMTLLTSSLNSALRNYNFEKKMNGEGRKKGIKAYADLSITKDDIVATFEKGDIVWDENKIKERTDKLEKEIKDIWG